MSNEPQAARETVVVIEAETSQQTRQNCQLEMTPAAHVEANAELREDLSRQRSRTLAIEQKFSSHEGEHKLGGQLGSLQEALVVFQAQLREGLLVKVSQFMRIILARGLFGIDKPFRGRTSRKEQC